MLAHLHTKCISNVAMNALETKHNLTGRAMQLCEFKTLGQRSLAATALCAALLVTGCGGGGGGGSPAPNPEGSSPISTPTMPNPTSTGPVTTPTVPTIPTTGTPPATSVTVPVGLQDPNIISRAGEGGNAPPVVAIDAAGNAISIWRREVDASSFPSTYELLARRFVAGTGWQAIQVLASGSTPAIEQPQLTINPATGKAMAVWIERRTAANGANGDVVARAYDPTSGWAPVVTIESNKPMIRFNVALATDTSGNVMAVWSRYESIQTTIYASRYTAAGGWSTPMRIDDENTVGGGGGGMLATFLSNGNALVVWNSSRGGTTSNIWGNQYTAGSGWGTNALVMSGSGAQTSGLLRLLGGVRGLAADQNGNAVLTFENQQQFDNPVRYEQNLWSKRYSGGAWGADSTAVPVGVPYSCTNCPSVYGGSVQINAQGQAVATWELRNANNKSVMWAARSANGSTWESTQLNADIPQFTPSGEFAQAGIDDQGNITVIWSAVNEVTSNTDINAARYTVGTGWAAPVLLEEYGGTSDRPSIAMNARGYAMTVWMLFENAIGTVIASRYFSSGR